jgi:hypothetical protein
MSGQGTAMQPVSQGSGGLRRFQEAFARALVGTPPPDGGADVARLLAQPGFAVYRNTVMKGCIDALQANYPAVTRLVGAEWLRAAAAVFVTRQRPSSARMLDYGAKFGDFLAGFEPAAELPYLPGVARLDRYWTEAHGARDETPVGAERLTALAQHDLERAVLRPHASARWAWFDGQPIFTIWSRNRQDNTDESEIAWHGEGALVVRPFDRVEFIQLGRADVAFLDACAGGKTLSDAAMAALAADGAADLSQTMAGLVAAGAFARIVIDRPANPESNLPGGTS